MISIEWVAALLDTLLIVASSLLIKRYVAQAGVDSARAMSLLVFAVAYLTSGISHLISDEYRGYFDLRSGSALFSKDEAIIQSSGLVLLALLGFWAGARSKFIGRPVQVLPSQGFAKWLLPMSVGLGVLGLWGLARVGAALEGVESSRVIELSGGYARYAYISHWVAWGVTFGACSLLALPIFRSAMMTFAIVGSSCIAIVSSFGWTGGRSIGLVFSLPLLLLVHRRLGRLKWPFFAGGILALSSYVIFLSVLRRQGYGYDEFSVVQALDWEFGRFSMVGFAIQSVRLNGYLFGETFISGFVQIVVGLMKIVGVDAAMGFRTVTQYTGAQILGASELTYIVPGLIPELYLNFGWMGVGAGMFGVGRLCRFLDRARATAKLFSDQLLIAYVAVITAFCLINAHSAAFLNYLIYSGAPVVVLPLVERLIGRGVTKMATSK